MFSIICAVGSNNEIGCENKLLWNLPKDMAFFKKKTLNHTVVMGKVTFESIGIALPKRKNIVIAKENNYIAKNCEICNNLNELIEKYKTADEEIFIIGGASIYQQFLPHASKLYLTLVDDAPVADTYFPDYKEEFKVLTESEKQCENNICYRFVELIKK